MWCPILHILNYRINTKNSVSQLILWIFIHLVFKIMKMTQLKLKQIKEFGNIKALVEENEKAESRKANATNQNQFQ